MSALQGKGRSRIVVEKRRPPLRIVVTSRTSGHTILCELLPVHVCMTTLALGRRRLEIHAAYTKFWIFGLVARNAARSLVRSEQRERSFRVIKMGEFFPGRRGMASFATHHGRAGPCGAHEFVKLPLVRIAVAGSAGKRWPVIQSRCVRPELRRLFMAIAAGNRHMASRQCKLRVFVTG
jgi:hypothetical protein